jgi:hypothetical protein
MVKPLAFKNSCSARTSCPCIPYSRFLVKEVVVLADMLVVDKLDVPSNAFKEAMVLGPTTP